MTPLRRRLEFVVVNFHGASLMGGTVAFAGPNMGLVFVNNSLGDAAANIVRGAAERFAVCLEKTDWLLRAIQRGRRTVLLPFAEILHDSAGSSPVVGSPHSLLLLGSLHRYARKHFGGIDAARLARNVLTVRAEAARASPDRIRVHLTRRTPRLS